MGPAILIRRLSSDPSLCPVASVESLISARASLAISHDSLFCADSSPFSPLDTSAFTRLLSSVLRDAGISAPPGSTRAMAASAAFHRGVNLSDVLHAGDWTGASTFFRFYARDFEGLQPDPPHAF